jgi:hypothetical protein
VKRIARFVGCGLLGLVLLGMAGWGVLAIYYSNLPFASLRTGAAAAFGLGTLTAFLLRKNRRQTALWFLVVFAGVVGWFCLIPASNDRAWQPDVSRLASASIQGDQVTVHNIRNCEYRSEADYTPRYYDKVFDLRQLDSVDLICVYWGSKAIAHVMLSFGFGGQDYLACSIETRKEVGEGYSTMKGFFRQFELVYVLADERDVVGLRTNYRQPREDVYLFRLRLPLENQRKLFLDYLRRVNELVQRPAWYNTLTDNCTTGVLFHTRAYPHRARYNWKILLSGYVPQYAYEIGGLDSSLTFDELRRRGYVNERAQSAVAAVDFSQRIRKGMPLPAPLSMEEFLSGRE